MFEPNPEFDKKRTKVNIELNLLLAELMLQNPSLRFGQILQNFGFVNVKPSWGGMEEGPPEWCNGFYEEPTVTLKRVQEAINAKP